MKLAFVISAVARLDLLHQREPEALRGSALDLPLDGRAAQRLADVLRRSDPDDAREAELDVDLRDDAHRRDGERDVRLTLGDLTRLRVERERARVPVDALDVDGASHPVALLERRAARGLHGAGRHPGHPRGRRGACRSDVRRGSGRDGDVLRPELEPRHLQDHLAHALTHLGGRAVHLRRAVLGEDDASGTEVVEALRVADVLEADREADAATHSLAARRVPRAAGEPDRLARKLLRLGRLESRRATDHLARRQRARHDLPGRERASRLERVQEPQLDRVDVERGGELVHLRLGREARLHRAEAAHRTARRVVRVDGEAVDPDVVDRVRADGERARVRDDRGRARRVRAAVDEDPHPHRHEPPLARRPVLGPDPRRVAVDVADERLLAVVDDLHGPPGAQREHRRVDLHREVLAPAERATDAGEVNPHLLGLEVEAGRDLVAVDVEPLRRDVDVDAALAVRDRDPGLGAEERLILLADVVDALDGDVPVGVGVAARRSTMARTTFGRGSSR